MKTTRRDFIKISGFSLGAIALGSPVVNQLMKKEGESIFGKSGKITRYPNYCEVCFWNCAGWVYKNEEGKLWKIIGNEDDPHSNGRFCPRGTGGIGMYEDEDRLKKPLMRVGKPGSQEYKEISWEEALDHIASKMKEIGQKYGNESIALFKHGSSSKHIGNLISAFGSGNQAGPAYAQCKGPREEAFTITFGEPLHSPEPLDIRDTKCLVLIGSHLGENMHNGQVQEMSEAIDKGVSVITVDPRFSTAASKSKYWLPIKPATDTALLLAWMNVIINENLFDKDYVEKLTIGFDKLKDHVQAFTPEWAYGITTIEPDKIRETAREMAKAAPAVIVHPGRHATWYGDDTQRLRAVAILNALLGSWGRRGGFYMAASAKLPKFQSPAYPKPGWGWRDILPDKYPFASDGVTNLIVDGSHPDYKGNKKIKAWFVMGTNLPVSMPDTKRTIEAIQNQEFIVVIDTMPTEITGYADIVLPECTYIERYDDIRSLPHREPNLALRVPAMEPRWESKPGWWIAKELSKRLGLEAYFNYNDYSEVLDWQLKQVGTSLEEMKKIGVKKYEREFDDLYFAEGEIPEFDTPSGKIELYSEDLASYGFPPLPVYKPLPQPDAGYFRLIYGRAPMHTFSRTTNNPRLLDLMSENKLWVNPKVAKEWDLENDQEIWLQNQDGIVSEFPIKVRITERIRWDSVYLAHGFGHADKRLTHGFGKGLSDTQMISKVLIDPESGGTGMRSNFVTFITEKPGKEVLS